MVTVMRVECPMAEETVVVMVAICLLREIMAAMVVIMTEITEEVPVEWTAEEVTMVANTSLETWKAVQGWASEKVVEDMIEEKVEEATMIEVVTDQRDRMMVDASNAMNTAISQKIALRLVVEVVLQEEVAAKIEVVVDVMEEIEMIITTVEVEEKWQMTMNQLHTKLNVEDIEAVLMVQPMFLVAEALEVEVA